MKINNGVLERFFLFVLSASCFVMISCDEDNPCSNIKNGVSYKNGEPYDVIDKLEDFGINYSKQYAELIWKIKVLYEEYGIVEGQEGKNEDYGNDENQGKKKKEQEVNNKDYESDNDQDENNEDYESDDDQDDEYKPQDEFITKVREIVEKNKGMYEETYKQIDKYTRKIPPMPWAYGCTIKGLVMYILHDPIIKCAVQYFDNYKRTKDETGETFEKMVRNPNGPIDEWHNCLVTFIRLLKLTYEELESDETDVVVHGKLWNQIQGLEYLLHFLCFGYRQGYFSCSHTVSFLKVFLNILGVFDFSVDGDVFSQGAKKLKYRAYFSCRTGLDEQVFGTDDVSEKYSDFICSKEKVCFSENISDIISKSKRANWMINDTKGEHFFHFYLCKNEDETVYYIHDGWYEYKDFLKKKLPDLQKKKWELIYYSIPFTYIILPKEVSVEQNRVININNVFEKYEFRMQFWDSLIPLLSTDLDLVEKCSDNLYRNFVCSNENETKVLFRYFLDFLVSFISCIVEAYNHFKLYKNQGEFNFNVALKDLLTSEVDGYVFPKDEKNIDIVEINNYYYQNKKEIDSLFPDEKYKGRKVENKDKVQPMLKLLRETISKMRWFLRNKNVVDLILGYYGVIYKKTEERVAFIKGKENKIPDGINEMFEEYVKKYFSSFEEDFVFKKLVHGKNTANDMYDGKRYKQADVLKVDWTKTGLNEEDLPIFRGKFDKYKFFESAQFRDVVK